MAPSPEPDPNLIDAAMALVRDPPRRPLVLGICGAQGSGKSTLARALVRRCAGEGVTAAALSLDDLYLDRARRALLAKQVHPLFATRGVPGTHDIDLGLALFAALDRGERPLLPRFDKATDEPVPRTEWPRVKGAPDVLVFEGWCIGARPQSAQDLSAPVNALEAREDRDGIWRGAVNAALAGPYQTLFARIDRLLLLAAPDFSAVLAWRTEQERELARERPDGTAVMDDAALARFVSHFERLTRHILAEMPDRADCMVRLDAARRIVSIDQRSGG